MGFGRLRRGPPPVGLRETQDRGLQAGRGPPRPCPRPALAFRHAAPGRPLSLLDADPTRTRRFSPAPAKWSRSGIVERRGIPADEGRCLHARRIAAFAQRGSTPNRSRCRTARKGSTPSSANTFRMDSTWRSKEGNKGRALFVMTIFQKIAASSFAAVRSTLRRRQLC